MANTKLGFQHTTAAATIYAIIRDLTGQAWDNTGTALEAYDTASLGDYDIAATEQGTASKFYVLTIPATLPAGVYSVTFHVQAGGSPAESDNAVWMFDMVEWNGTDLIGHQLYGALKPTTAGRTLTIGTDGVGQANLMQCRTLSIAPPVLSSAQGDYVLHANVDMLKGAVASATYLEILAENYNDNGALEANLVFISDSPIVETSAGRIVGNFNTFFDNADAASAQTQDDVGGSGDDAATIYSYFVSGSNEDAFKADVSGLATQASVDVIDGIVDDILVDTGTTIPATLGVPAFGDIATDIANVYVDTQGIQVAIGIPAFGDIASDIANAQVTMDNVYSDTQGIVTLIGMPVVDVSTDIASVKTAVDAIAMDVLTVDGVLDALVITVGVAGAGLTDLGGMSTGMKAEVNAEADTALADYDGPTNAEMAARTLAAADYFDFTTDTVDVGAINGSTLAAIRLALSAGQIIPGTVDTVTNSHTPTTIEFQADDITEATNDHYNGRIIIFTSGALAGQATAISDYSQVGGIGQFIVVALTEAPSDDDTFIIL